MKILMVCLGNICRSPIAEGILSHRARERGINIIVDSCGTGDYHIGSPPDKRAIHCAGQNGMDITNQRARQFSVRDFEEFDIIYAMDKMNYKHLYSLAKTEEHKKKIKLILDHVEPGKNRDVPDPYYGGPEDYNLVLKLLSDASDKILEELENEKR